MATSPRTLMLGVFAVQIDTRFTLAFNTVELDAYAVVTDGERSTPELSLRYAQVSIPANGFDYSKFVRSTDTETIQSFPQPVQDAYAALVAEAALHQQQGRMLREA